MITFFKFMFRGCMVTVTLALASVVIGCAAFGVLQVLQTVTN